MVGSDHVAAAAVTRPVPTRSNLTGVTDGADAAAAGLTSRPGRLALVAPDLAQLHGPTSGWVELPHRLVWLPAQDRRFNLDDASDRLHLYEIVLRARADPARRTEPAHRRHRPVRA